MMRDGGDLFAGVSGKKCVAAHLDPVTRPHVYKGLLDVEFLHDVSYGLAIGRSLHRAYKAYRWSIYCKDDRYSFHAFDGGDPDLVQLHGRFFSVQDLRYLAPPDPRLCAWHYRQAVLKYGRGFAVPSGGQYAGDAQ
ncbi:hypothetical protein JCM8202_001210 [Rhodotorula sphaerocarpa]